MTQVTIASEAADRPPGEVDLRAADVSLSRRLPLKYARASKRIEFDEVATFSEGSSRAATMLRSLNVSLLCHVDDEVTWRLVRSIHVEIWALDFVCDQPLMTPFEAPRRRSQNVECSWLSISERVPPAGSFFDAWIERRTHFNTATFHGDRALVACGRSVVSG